MLNIKIRTIFWLVIASTLIMASCSQKSPEDANDVSSTENTLILLDWFEANGNYISDEAIPSIMDAQDVYAMRNQNILIIDLRSAEDFMAGHIEHAINLQPGEVLDYFKNTIDPNAFENIFFVCNNLDLSGYVTGVVRLLGYSNTYSIRFGMSGWNREIAEKYWLANIGNQLLGKLEYGNYPKNKPGDFPGIAAQGNTGFEIAWERAEAVIGEPLENFVITIDKMIGNWDNYYSICYWPEDKYLSNGHLPGAAQYNPKTSLSRNTQLNTLSLEKPNIVYCYSGQHSLYVTAYLRMLGYDARSLAYGANGFIHQVMAETEPRPTRTFTEKLIQNLPVVKGGILQPSDNKTTIPTETVKVAGGC